MLSHQPQDKFQSFKKTSKEVEVGQTSASTSKTGTSRQTENLEPSPPLRNQPSSHMDEAMEVDLYSPSLPPCLRGDHSMHNSDPRQSKSKNVQIRESTKIGPGICLSHLLQRMITQRSSKPSRAHSEQDQSQHNPVPLFVLATFMLRGI